MLSLLVPVLRRGRQEDQEGVQGQPWLPTQFEDSLVYMRLCFKRPKTIICLLNFLFVCF